MRQLFHRLLHGHRFEPAARRRGPIHVFADCAVCGRTYIVRLLRNTGPR